MRGTYFDKLKGTEPTPCAFCGEVDTSIWRISNYNNHPSITTIACDECGRDIARQAVDWSLDELPATRYPITADEARGWADRIETARQRLGEVKAKTTDGVALTMALDAFVIEALRVADAISGRAMEKKREQVMANAPR